MDYKTSGVDVEAGRAFVERIRSAVEQTHRPEVIGGLGGFGGLTRLPEGYSRPILVAGTDGVGTKLELAQANDAHFGVGLDLVAMCVNDVITCAAKPLFFLDYIATGVLSQKSLAEVVEGIAKGCKQSGCSLLGGETAEMPGFYKFGKYDLAGFCVALVEENLLIDGKFVRPGDQILGIASSGLHSNGYSLVRKILDEAKCDVDKKSFGPQNSPLMDTLLEPTIIYASLVESLLSQKIPVKAMAHITGGGLPENLPRCLPAGLQARIDPLAWKRPELFNWLQEVGEIPERDIWNTFNLGIGFCIVLPKENIQFAQEICLEEGLSSWIIGTVQESFNQKEKKLLGIPD